MNRTAANAVLKSAALGDLIEMRDRLASAKNMAAASVMACHALDPRGNERAALIEVTNACREQLEDLVLRLDALVTAAKPQGP